MPQTKKKIFDTAVKLFSEKSYDKISMRDIARTAGVNESTAYYYYESKEALMAEILDVYRNKLEKYLITREQAQAYLKTETPREILTRLISHFKDEEELFMLRANRIVCMEQYTNPKAKDIVMDSLMDKTAESIKTTLDVLMEHRKIPVFDTKPVSVIWCDFLYTQSARHANLFFYGETEQLKSSDFISLGNTLIDMVIGGRLPKIQG